MPLPRGWHHAVESMRHTSHPAEMKRLRRVDGHLRSVLAEIESSRPCLDIAEQLHAIERAVVDAKRTLIRDHRDQRLDTTGTLLPSVVH